MQRTPISPGRGLPGVCLLYLIYLGFRKTKVEGGFCPEDACREVWTKCGLRWHDLRDTGSLGSFGARLLLEPQQSRLASSQGLASPSLPGLASWYSLCFFTLPAGHHLQEWTPACCPLHLFISLELSPPLQTALVSWLLIPHFFQKMFI